MRRRFPVSTAFGMVAGVALVLVSGCSMNVSRPAPDKRYFSLDVSRPGVSGASSDEGVLLIRPVRISPRYEGRGLIYRLGRFDYESDYYNEWFVSPRAMLTEQLRRWLDGSGLFRQVVDGTSPVEPHWMLDVSVTSLYGDFRDTARPAAVVECQAFLVDDQGREPTILFKKDYAEREVFDTREPAALVAGWNVAFERILGGLERDLRNRRPANP